MRTSIKKRRMDKRKYFRLNVNLIMEYYFGAMILKFNE